MASRYLFIRTLRLQAMSGQALWRTPCRAGRTRILTANGLPWPAARQLIDRGWSWVGPDQKFAVTPPRTRRPITEPPNSW